MFNKLLEETGDLKSTINSLIEEKAELEELIIKLKVAKDSKEVSEIIKSRKPSSQFQEFIELCGMVKKRLDRYPSIINGIIFKSYTGKEISIKWEANEEEIDEAYANDYIDDDLQVRWDETSEMKRTGNALDKVKDFIGKDLGEDFFQIYEENFDSPLNIENKLFWEELFEASISLS
jgi:hypothetical protein